MAGSYEHCTDKETGKFYMDSIENMGDAHEALEMMHAMVNILAGGDRSIIKRASERYYAWCRGEVQLPEWPGLLD